MLDLWGEIPVVEPIKSVRGVRRKIDDILFVADGWIPELDQDQGRHEETERLKQANALKGQKRTPHKKLPQTNDPMQRRRIWPKLIGLENASGQEMSEKCSKLHLNCFKTARLKDGAASDSDDDVLEEISWLRIRIDVE
jgi:hypothetical protein